MSDIVKCSKCQGRKRFLGAGMMEHDCDGCNGIGWVKKPVEQPVTDIQIDIVEEEPKRKGGRRKKTDEDNNHGD